MVPIWLIYRQRDAPLPSTHLEQESVASLLLDGGLDSEGVGDGQVVTDNLDLGRGVEVGPRLPVILVEGVLNRDNVVLLDVALVDLGKLLSGEGLGLVRVGVLYISTVMSLRRSSRSP
jgi:hypothetical protein